MILSFFYIFIMIKMMTINDFIISLIQRGITCEAIDEPSKSSKAIDKRVIINFRDKNVVIAGFRDKNEVFILFIFIYVKVAVNSKQLAILDEISQ